MRNLMRRTAAAALAGTMAAGLLTGCGEAKLDGTKIAATVNKTEIPMGLVSLYARVQQAQTDAMYKSFMGTGAEMWDDEVDEESGETYGQQLVSDSLDSLELMFIMKEKSADYGVEVTKEDQEKIADAASAFMEANGEEVIEELAVTEEQVKMFLELQTYRERMYDPIAAEANIEITDEEANQSAFTYVSVSTSSEELTEEDIAKKKEQAQEILDKMKEDPEADMTETAKSVDESYTSLSGTFTTTANDDIEDSYPAEVMEVLRTLKEGEVASDLIETENGFYIVRLDKAFDEDATKSKRESLKETRENEYYQEVTDKWMEEADIEEEEKVLNTLKITNAHSFVLKTPEEEMEPEEPEFEDVNAEDADAEDANTENADAEDANTEDAEDANAENGDTKDAAEVGGADDENVTEAPEEETEEADPEEE